MNIIITILLLLGVYFIIYGSTNVSSSSPAPPTPAASTRTRQSKLQLPTQTSMGRQPNSLLNMQYHGGSRLNSFFSDLFGSQSVALSYPYGSLSIIPEGLDKDSQREWKKWYARLRRLSKRFPRNTLR